MKRTLRVSKYFRGWITKVYSFCQGENFFPFQRGGFYACLICAASDLCSRTTIVRSIKIHFIILCRYYLMAIYFQIGLIDVRYERTVNRDHGSKHAIFFLLFSYTCSSLLVFEITRKMYVYHFNTNHIVKYLMM